MTIDNEEQLHYSYRSIVRMYELIDKIAADTTGYPETREDEIEGVRAMIRKIERQIAAYYAAHPEHLAIRGPVLEDEVALDSPTTA